MVLPLCHNSGDCWPAHKFIKKPGNPYDFQEGTNPFLNYLNNWETDNNIDKIKSSFDLNHNMSSNYDFNDHVLPIGAAYWATLVENELQN